MSTPKSVKRPIKGGSVPPHARLQSPAFQPVPSIATEIANARAEANSTRAAGAGGRQNLYVAAKDQETWSRAEKLSEPESLSGLVTRLLRRLVEQREAAAGRIVLEMHDSGGNVVRTAFKGRMLVSDYGAGLNAAQGARGGIALWVDRPGQGVWIYEFATYESWEDVILKNGDGAWPADFLSAVSSAMGEEYAEEIDL